MVQLKEKNKDNSIPVSELKDGQIAVITEWSNGEDYIGLIIQKFMCSLITIGKNHSGGWDKTPTSKDCRVRVLEEGTELIITNNQ